MSDLAVSWVAAAPSAWRHRLRGYAVGVSAGVLSALIAIRGFDSPSLAALAGFLACAVVVVLALGGAPVCPRLGAWKIAPDGGLTIRLAPGDEHAASVQFVSGVLIVLRGGGASLEIWRDATPIRAFRRLSVAARWSAARHRGAALTADRPNR